MSGFSLGLGLGLGRGPRGANVPTITSASIFSIVENTTAVATLTASHPDPDAVLVWSKTGGIDQSFFTLSSSGVLTITARNYESAADANANNVYIVDVQVTDGVTPIAQTLAVTITNANEAPTAITWGGSHTVAENSALTTVVGGALGFTDPDALATGTFSLDDNGNAFRIGDNGTSIVVDGIIDYEVTTSINITVRFTDQGGLYTTQVFAVTVTDVDESVTNPVTPTTGLPNNGTILSTGTYTVVPTGKGHGNGGKIGGKSSTLAAFIYDIGPRSAGTVLGVKYTPDFTQLSNQGRDAMIGFGFKNGTDFHLVGLHGDGANGANKYKFFGTNYNNLAAGANTRVDGGAAAHGSRTGTTMIALEIASDGSTYNFYSGAGADDFPVPSTGNTGGTGDRTSIITVTTTATVSGGTINNIIDGGSTANSTDALWFANGQTTREIKFDFATAKVINSFTWTQDNSATHGTWKIAGSNNDSAYTDLSTGLALGGVSTTYNFTNLKGYRYYKLIQTAGTTSSSPWIKEIEFSIFAGAGLDLEYSASGPSPIANVPAAAQFGIFLLTEGTDVGSATVDISVWQSTFVGVYQQYAEVINSGSNNKVRLSQQYAEAIHSGETNLVRLSNQYAETIHSGDNNLVRLSNQYAEVIVPYP